MDAKLESIFRFLELALSSPARREMIATIRAHIERLEADLSAVRSLMNLYNLGGWTDAIGPMKRAEAAEARVRELEGVLREVRGYLAAASEGSMSRNNAEQLAHELGEEVDAALQGANEPGNSAPQGDAMRGWEA